MLDTAQHARVRYLAMYDTLPREVRDVMKDYPVTARDILWLYQNQHKVTPSALLRATKEMAERVRRMRSVYFGQYSSGIY